MKDPAVLGEKVIDILSQLRLLLRWFLQVLPQERVQITQTGQTIASYLIFLELNPLNQVIYHFDNQSKAKLHEYHLSLFLQYGINQLKLISQYLLMTFDILETL